MASRCAKAVRTLMNISSKSSASAVTRSTLTGNRLLFSLPKRSLSSLTGKCITINSNITLQQTRNYGDAAEESVEESTVNVLKLFDKVDPTKVSLDAHFINDLGLDSLDVVEVVMAFEDEFGIEISDEEAEKILTVQQAVDLIKAKLD